MPVVRAVTVVAPGADQLCYADLNEH